VEITGNSVNVRSAPGTSSRVLGVVHKGDLLPWQGESRSVDGRDWYLVEFAGQNGWVSSKFSRVVE
jgi:N-acetylmuramoyl-L-alanine amidase